MSSFFQPGGTADPIYRRTRDGPEDHHIKGREYLERIWVESCQYIDPDSRERATRDLPSVFWELQLAYALKCAGKGLLPRDRLGYKSNKGPDLFVEDPGVWVEAVVVRSGTGPDALQQAEIGEAYDYDPDPLVLRLRSVIRDKSTKLADYVKDKIIKPGQATVIAISGVALPYRYRFTGRYPPEIVRAVYPVNNPVVEINRITMAQSEPYVEYRDSIQKTLGAKVSTDVFLDSVFAHVSAVLYDDASWVNQSDQPGADFKIVHNPKASTPLPDRWYPAGDEYWWRDDGRIERRRHSCHG
jgi:hypothetical protein